MRSWRWTWGVGLRDVKIDWKKHHVEYKKNKIFETKKGGERVYTGVGKEVSAEVEAKIKAWLEKRHQEDSD